MHACIIQASTCVEGTSPRITQTTASLYSPILIETVQHVERTLAKQLGAGNSNETADKPANSDTSNTIDSFLPHNVLLLSNTFFEQHI